jgi:hypothetical protein
MILQIEAQDDILVATLAGPASLDELRRAFEQAFSRAAAENFQMLLFDGTGLTGTLSTMERYDLGVDAAKYVRALGTSPHFAVFGQLPTTDGFGVRVAQNRGMRTEMFREVETAMGWLRNPGSCNAPTSVSAGAVKY